MRLSRATCFWPRFRLLAASEGITTIEFALITPVMLLIVMGIVEFALIMFTMAVMESATGMTSRLGKTGYVPVGMTRQDAIIKSIDDKTAGLLTPAKISITTKVYPGMNNVSKPEPYTDSNHNGMYNAGEPYTDSNGNGSWDADMGAAGLGNANDVVLYTISYPWPVMTPVLKPILGSTFNIKVRTVVKNEPY